MHGVFFSTWNRQQILTKVSMYLYEFFVDFVSLPFFRLNMNYQLELERVGVNEPDRG